ncbi:MAG: hypothetical protein AB7I19_01640 [Planctomycetota bacterium]
MEPLAPVTPVLGSCGADALLLDFVMPGVIHSLGNSLFAVQGIAHVLGAGRQTARQRETILEACQRAEQALDVLRHLGPLENDPPRSEQAGLLLMRMREVCRVPLRERGMRLEIAHSSKDSPRRVDVRTMTRGLIEVLRCIALEVQAGFEGELTVDLCTQEKANVALDLWLRTDPGYLPFPVAMSAARAHSEGVLSAMGASVECWDRDRLRILIPAAAREPRR